ncbi:MAG: transglutaminase family protein [Alphaproteobacteria bacterium]|nr:transglutaminase family protein [Alphaproteobacteria bacterium]
MNLHVRHTTHFEFSTRVNYSVQRLLLTPLSFASQRVEHWHIHAPGIEQALAYYDGFGNLLHLVTCENAGDQFDVVAEGVVSCMDAQGIVQGLAEITPKAIFLRQTETTNPSLAMLEFLASPALQGLEGLAFLHALMRAVHHHVAFEVGVTDTFTTAAHAFARGAGVCQDHAHIFLGLTRFLGIPARYVTGYLVTGVGASSTAAHAWAEVLVKDLGWVGFDVANCMCPTDHYVRVASGIDAASITPIRGVRRGGMGETMTVEVRVEIAQQ